MPEDKPRRAYDKITFDQVLFTQNIETLQHLLVLAVIKSYRFYKLMKLRLCPLLPDNRSFRPDFTRPDFNYIYSFTAQFWESLARHVNGDMSIKSDLMDLIFAKKAAAKFIPEEDATAILSWLKIDIAEIDVEPGILQTLPDNQMVTKWLEERAMDYEHRRLSAQALGRSPTLADMEQSVRSVKQSIQSSAPKIVSTKNILFTKTQYRPPVPVRLREINRMIGGGFQHAEAAIIGAISGGGKTVLAMQFALDFILGDHKTVVLTTEQSPEQLVYRMISNHLNMEFGIFTDRLDAAIEKSLVGNVELEYLPATCLDFEHYGSFNDFAYKAEHNLLFMDWSDRTKTFERDFESEIQLLSETYPDFDPEIVIVDWVGGGIDVEGVDGQYLRHYYKAAAETIIKHGKRTNRVMIAFAQLNKTLIKPTSNLVTMGMLAECKTLTDNAATFLGITALQDFNRSNDVSSARFRPLQFICADKARYGPGGTAKVKMKFMYQRFEGLTSFDVRNDQ